MVVPFAVALDITTDALLRPKAAKPPPPRRISRKALQRLERIENLPPYRQRALLTTIDSLLQAGNGDRKASGTESVGRGQ